jgi:hypothetical protein
MSPHPTPSPVVSPVKTLSLSDPEPPQHDLIRRKAKPRPVGGTSEMSLMTQENVLTTKTPRPPTPVAEDYSEEIIRFVKKQPHDRVTCKHVSGNNYRCNWWAPASGLNYDNPKMTGLTVTTHVVRQSRFLTVTKTAAGLVVNDWASTPRSEHEVG